MITLTKKYTKNEQRNLRLRMTSCGLLHENDDKTKQRKNNSCTSNQKSIDAIGGKGVNPNGISEMDCC